MEGRIIDRLEKSLGKAVPDPRNDKTQQQQDQLIKILSCMVGHVRGMEDKVMQRLESRLDEAIESMKDDKTGEWEQLIRNLVDQELDEAIQSNLESSWAEHMTDLREECLNELKNDLEAGMVSIVLPR